MTATTTKIDQLVEELKTHLTAARDIGAKADEENRDFTDAERAQVVELMGKADAVKKKLDTARSDAKVRQTIQDLGDDIGVDHSTQGKGRKNPPSDLWTPEGGDGATLGEHFTSSEAYKAVLESAPGGHFTKDHRVQSRPVGYKHLLPRTGRKTLVTGASDTSAGAFVQNDYLGLRSGLGPFMRPLRLRDVVTSGRTTSDTIEYVRVTGVTNAAAPVAEATATGDTSGTKPESGLTTARVTTPVRTLAHWIPVTKRAMSDAAQIMTLIDQFLQYGLEEVIDEQMIAGDGTGENLEGLANVSGTQTQAAETVGENLLLTTLRKALTKVRIVGRANPTAYVMHPTDVETLDLQMDGMNRYYFGGPGGTYITDGGSAGPLWRRPIIESESVTQGTAWVGDWSKAILWDREQASITMSDSHANFFIRNMVAILAECRVAFGIIQPSAFVEITLPA